MTTRVEQPLRVRAEAGAERAGALAGSSPGSEGWSTKRKGRRARERAGGRGRLERARLGGAGQIRLLEIDESTRAPLEAEARELTDEAERLATAAAEAAELARSASGARADAGGARLARRRPASPRARGRGAVGRRARRSSRCGRPLRCAAARARGRRRGAHRRAGASLRELGAAEVGLRQEAEDAAQRATTIEIELTRIEAEAADARRRLEESHAGAAALEAAEGDDRDELAARAERLEARRMQLGQVNPLAKEEYEARRSGSTSSSHQRADLEASLTSWSRCAAS